MKKSILLFFTIATLAITGLTAKAQDYQKAAGLKFGPYEIGPSFKYFMTQSTAVEGILGFRKGGAVLTGLYQIHVPVFDVDKLKFYYGAGGHLGAIGSGTYDDGRHIYTNNRLKIGLDALVGLEYLVPQSPVVIGVDLDPRIEFATGSVFDIAPALNLRYSF